MKEKKPDPKIQAWIDARRRHRLSHAQIQMARELGMNPKRFGGKDNHRQEPWKVPLPQFIELVYLKRFGKQRPDLVLLIEEKMRRDQQTQRRKKAERLGRKAEAASQAKAGEAVGES